MVFVGYAVSHRQPVRCVQLQAVLSTSRSHGLDPRQLTSEDIIHWRERQRIGVLIAFGTFAGRKSIQISLDEFMRLLIVIAIGAVHPLVARNRHILSQSQSFHRFANFRMIDDLLSGRLGLIPIYGAVLPLLWACPRYFSIGIKT